MNQDSVGCHAGPLGRLPAIIAVADGHGSDKCPRSHIGAHFAVQTAIQIGTEFCDATIQDSFDLIEQKLKSVPRDFVREWRRRVIADTRRYPFSQTMTVKTDANVKLANRPPTTTTDPGPYLAYGTTVLVAIVDTRFIVTLQLGDGNIMATSPNCSPRSLTKPSRHVADDTDSLCMSQADELFQYCMERRAESELDMLLLCTDGFSKSYASDDQLLKATADYHQLLQTAEGRHRVATELSDWLCEHSHYSGDDTSLAIAHRMNGASADALPSPPCTSFGPPQESSSREDTGSIQSAPNDGDAMQQSTGELSDGEDNSGKKASLATDHPGSSRFLSCLSFLMRKQK